MDNEKTILDNKASMQRPGGPVRPQQQTAKNGNNNATVLAVAGGSAVVLGTAAALFMSGAKADDETTKGTEDTNVEQSAQTEQHNTPDYLLNDDINVAEGVNDSMSFNTAFATARAEVGPGGIFEWRGNVYATYTKEEWDSKTPAEKAEYQDNFAWNHHDHHTHSTDVQYAHHTETTTTHVTEVHHHYTEVVVDDDPAPQPGAETTDVRVTTDVPETDIDVVSVDEEPEIEVLGVVHDAETGTNVGMVSFNDTQVAFIDVDNNLEFDYMGVDENDNGSYEDNEIEDISSEHITVDDLGGFTDGYEPGELGFDDPVIDL